MMFLHSAIERRINEAYPFSDRKYDLLERRRVMARLWLRASIRGHVRVLIRHRAASNRQIDLLRDIFPLNTDMSR